MSEQKFVDLLRRQLKLSNCSLRKSKGERSYTITTQENDIFWLYWYELPSVELEFLPVGRPRCGQTTIYQRTISAHINHCISRLQADD